MRLDDVATDLMDSSAGATAVLEPAATETDPFATPSDPFATPSETPADAPADPFATPSETPADAPAADPFASTETPAETPPADAPADAPAEESGGVGLTLEEKPQKKGLQKKERKQFRILVLADFSGRTNRGILEKDNISSRKVRTIDADSLDKTIAAVKPEIQLPVDDKTMIPLAFKAIEDFRPDALIQQIAAFQNMLKLREQLKDNKKFKEAAAAVRKLSGTAAPKKARPAAGAAERSEFEKMLDRPVASKGAGAASADALIANLVAGYGVPDADPEQGKMVKLVEDALAAGLRAVLRHPAFQALEGAWRGIEFLVSRLNTDEELKICLLDISKDELYADLAGPPTIEKTGMFQILVEQTRSAGAIPFSLVIGDYEFDQSPQNVALLAKLASLMHAAEIPFVGGATAKIPGFASYAKATDSGKWQPPSDIALWDKIRGHKLSPHIGLTAPRFLIRMPYGPKTDAIEAFPFDEMPAPATEQYLWANGAFAVALLIGQAFLENGWEGIEPGNDVSDLPCHMAVVDGDKEMTPCAQAWLSDRVGDILRNLGLIPVISVKNAASVKIAGIQSIAKPAKPLAASWGAQ